MIGYELPVSVNVGGKEYSITNRGDFRMILDCFSALNDKEVPKSLRVADSLIIFYEDINSDEDIQRVFGDHAEEAVKQMFSFFNCYQLEGGTKVNHKLIDWEQDAQLVCAAVNTVAQTEIRSEPYLHWFTFLGYYMSVGDSVLATVVALRDKRARGKKLEKHEREFINDHPEYFFTTEEIEEQQEIDEILQELLDK